STGGRPPLARGADDIPPGRTFSTRGAAALAAREAYQPALTRAGYGAITTEIRPAPPFYYAEGYHQQYLAKNPGGYCGLGGTGVACSAGVATAG
ncbi:MAG TPA: peptide-methionine (S)-S-oxide reductase, partial [Methylomirabilota bacterium]|nr:peptide-methionine (S)-S-oxide reductase [Methylomirabilota bacterium]